MSALSRLKLLDPDGRVSLTNLALYIVLGAFVYCVGRAGQVDVTSLGALLTALAAYRVKALQADTTDARASELEDKAAARDVEKLKADLSEARKALDNVQRSVTSAARPSALPAGLR